VTVSAGKPLAYSFALNVRPKYNKICGDGPDGVYGTPRIGNVEAYVLTVALEKQAVADVIDPDVEYPDVDGNVSE